MRKIKSVALFGTLLVFLVSPSLAHPPSEIIADFDFPARGLKLTVRHDSDDPSSHFVYRLVILKNDVPYFEKRFTAQTDESAQEINVPREGIEAGDRLRIIAYCALDGRIEHDLTAPPLSVWRDGVYTARNMMLNVIVTVNGGRITAIEIPEHRGGGEKYKEMVSGLVDRILSSQSIAVDGITGATVSSQAFKEAVGEALKQAER